MENKNKELAHVEDPVERTMSIEIQKSRISEETYLADDAVTDRTKKSPAEKRLLLKSDLVIVPLAALIYFTAYLVCHYSRPFSSMVPCQKHSVDHHS